jgi:hypothetical protein
MAHRMAFVDSIRNMSEQDYETLKTKFNKGGQTFVKREIEVL